MLKQNIIANFFGRVWPSILAFFFVPVYLHYLGVEAYGLIGFFISFQAMIGFLDLGLSATANREIALRSMSHGLMKDSRDLIRTLEIVYGIVAILIAITFFSFSDFIASDWIKAREISAHTISLVTIVFGITFAFRWPVSLYSGVLQGLEKQVLLNIIIATISSVRTIGAVIIVVFVSPTILAYVYWQFGIAIIEVCVMARIAWRHLPGNHTPSIKYSILRDTWKFSASVGFNSLLAAFLKQLDRLLISKILLLAQVGYYTTANVVYSAISIFISPLATAAFPRFTILIAEKNEVVLANTYHKLSQMVSFIVTPITCIIFFYSKDILLYWTHSEDVAFNASTTLSILAIAALFNSMMQIPFMLLLAAGITWISLWNNAINLLLLSPFMYFLIVHYGIAGAGISWAVFNIIYYTVVPHIMHLYVLKKEKSKWFFQDTLPFMILGFVIYGGIHFLNVNVQNAINKLIIIMIGSIVYFVICLILFAQIRNSLNSLFLNNSIIKRFILKMRKNHEF